MYKNDPTGYGYKMTFSGFIDIEEMEDWAQEVQRELRRAPTEWHCFVDMRDLDTMSPDAQELMSRVKAKCHDQGLTRVSTLVASPTVRLQFEQMSEETGRGTDLDRYLDVQSTNSAEEVALQWVRDAVDPDA